MRLKQIAAVCAKQKRVILYDVTDAEGTVNQWIGDGSAAYPAYGMPYLVKDNIFTVFDIPVKQQDKWYALHLNEQNYDISFKDMSNTDKNVEQLDITVRHRGAALVPFRTKDAQVIFINADYLRPIAHILDEVTFVERTSTGGTRYIVALNAFMVAAIIMPMDPLRDGELLKQLSGLVTLCENTKPVGEDLAT